MYSNTYNLYNVSYYDSYNDPIDKIYQWDTDITVTLKGLENVTPMPAFHFCYRGGEVAYVVKTVSSNGGISGKIPNILLQQKESLILYVYQDDSSAPGGHTINMINIAVIARAKPTDYQFSETVDFIDSTAISGEIAQLRRDFDNYVAQGGGGTTNYNDLNNRPKINGVELIGNKTSDELKLAGKEYVDTQDRALTESINKAKRWRVCEVMLTTSSENPEQITGISSLSSQEIYKDYTNNIFTLVKAKIDSPTTAKALNVEFKNTDDFMTVPVSSYRPDFCLASQTLYASGFIVNIGIDGNNVEVVQSTPDYSLGLYSMKVGQGIKAKRVYVTDKGKQTGIVEEWEPVDLPSYTLPTPVSADDGKILRVRNGEYVLEALSAAEDNVF